MRVFLAAAVAAVGLVPACGSSTTSSSRSPGGATGSAIPSMMQQSSGMPMNMPHAMSVGDAMQADTGVTYNVLTWKGSLAAAGGAVTSPPGGSLAAAQVKECAAGTKALDVGPSGWYLVMPDGSHLAPGVAAGQLSGTGTAFGATTLQPGACQTGWIGFAIPAGPAPTGLMPAGTDFYWTVP